MLEKAGVEIYEYRPGLLHATTMVIDGIWVTIGSTSVDNRSFALNDELDFVVYDWDVARRLESVFDQDLARSGKLEYRRWLSRGFFDRLLELLALPLQGNL